MSAQTTDRTRRATWVTAVMLGLLALACAPSIAAPAATAIPAATPWPTFPPELDWPSQGEGTVGLEVVNDLGRDICALYISPPADQTWGGNWLETGDRVPDGESRRLDIPPGHYDLMVEDCDHQPLDMQTGVALIENLTITFAPHEIAGSDEAPPASQEETIPIWANQTCLHPAVTANDPIAIRVPWRDETVEAVENMAGHITFTISVDGEWRSISPVRHPAAIVNPARDFGCQVDEPVALSYWDLPIGRLEAGPHEILVNYLTDIEFDNGQEVFAAGEIVATLERTIVVLRKPSPGMPGGMVLSIFNDSSEEICDIWIGPPQSEWIDNILEEVGSTLLSGESLSIVVLRGTWAFRALDCLGNELAFEPELDLTVDRQWVITGEGTEAATTCGDGICQVGEGYENCPADCNPPAVAAKCGDGFCDASEGPDSGNFCPYDCGWCGDGFCTDPELFGGTCPADCN